MYQFSKPLWLLVCCVCLFVNYVLCVLLACLAHEFVHTCTLVLY